MKDLFLLSFYFFLAVSTVGSISNAAIKCSDLTKERNARNASFATERTEVRLTQKSDLEAVEALFMDPQAQSMSGVFPTHEEIERLVTANERTSPTKAWKRVELSVFDKESGKLIASLDFVRSQASRRRAALGYMLSKANWGKGIMSEVVSEALKYGREQLGIKIFLAFTIKSNIGSQRVLEKAGFVKDGEDEMYNYYRLRTSN